MMGFSWSTLFVMITLLGATASGKTALAVAVARYYGGEIISADSRQVYAELNLGVGKDLLAYEEDGASVPYHLIGHIAVSQQYDVFSFVQDFHVAKADIVSRRRLPILCGGTGLYLDAVLRGYLLPAFNEVDADSSDEEAIEMDSSLGKPVSSVILGLAWEPEMLRHRIRYRLQQRLDAGMIEEVRGLLAAGVPAARLDRLGLEYRYVLAYLQGGLGYDEMVHFLGREICRYAKRQRTWFRRMERGGVNIHWILGDLDTDRQMDVVKKIVETHPALL